MRQFKLYNAIGEVYDLNSLDFFMYDPEQLGFKQGTKYERVGDAFHPYQEGYDQPKPKGKIRFKQPGAYDKYNAFVKFVSKKPLRLEYTPADATFKLQCEVGELKKTEIKTIGLSCDITFTGLGLWYRTLVEETSDDESGDGKKYDYEYDYVYSNSAAGTVALVSDAQDDSPTKITIYGPVVNPVWNHYLNGNRVNGGAVNATIPSGHKLVVDATTMPWSITEQDAYGHVVHDRYPDSDWNTDRFIFLQQGTNKISISHTGVNTPKLMVEVNLQYASV